jgi:hypothetical protein
VTGTVSAPSAAPSPGDAPKRFRPSRLVIGVAIAAMVAMWVYVLYLAVGPGRQGPPDELDDPAFAIAAQARCEQALAVVEQLPHAADTTSANERASVVEEANAAFRAMLDDLDALVPGGEDGEIVQEWLTDWRTYLDDRELYADALREDEDSRLLVSPKDGQHITEYLDAFAADNHMPACSTPLDVA